MKVVEGCQLDNASKPVVAAVEKNEGASESDACEGVDLVASGDESVQTGDGTKRF